MKTWVLVVLALIVFGCRDKIADPGDGSGGGSITGSDGFMPLVVGNWWDYRYFPAPDTVSDFRRYVRPKRSIEGQEYYLLVDSVFGTGALDTVCFMREVHNEGIIVLNYPLDTLGADTLFKYPNVHSGNYYWFHQDCVLVLYDYPGGPQHGPMSYQQFVGATHSSRRTYDLGRDSTGMTYQSNGGPDGHGFWLVGSHLIHPGENQ